jgi:ubiquinone/menaquinone biosynthesis C-methylase UbiE
MPVMSSIESAFCRSSPWARFAERKILPWALRGLRPGGHVLELGSGSGAMAAATARGNPDTALTVTDLDPVMVRAAAERLAGLRNVDVRQADITCLPFEDDTFDVVTSYLMLHHVIEWRPALDEVRRVLKPGGTFVGYDLQRTLLATAVHTLDRSPFALISRSELQRGLSEAGFVDVSVTPALGRLAMRFTSAAS